jgi:multiple sugar transport system substrate-binding protein
VKKVSVLLIVALLWSIAACAPAAAPAPEGGAAAGEAVTINLWAGFTGDDSQAMAGMVDGFEQENPGITVEYFSAPWSEMFAKFATAFGTDTGPDVVIMHATDIPNFASRDMLTPLDDLKEQLGISESSYAAPVWAGNAYGGTQWGIPLDYHPMAVFKNVAAFEQAGLDPNMEFNSAEEFLDAARKLTVKNDAGEVVQHGIAVGSDHAHTMRYWYGWLFQAGGQFLNAEGTEAAFNSEAGVKALTFLADLVNAEGVAPFHESDIDRDFLSGKVAMVIEGPWFVPTVNQTDVEYTVAPFPQVFENEGVWAGSHTLTVPAYSAGPERRDAALKLISYIAENSLEWGRASGQIPASNDVVNSEAYTALDNYQYAKAFIDQADSVHYEPLIPKTAELGADNQLSPVLNAVYAAVRGEATPEEALNEAAEATNEILQ